MTDFFLIFGTVWYFLILLGMLFDANKDDSKTTRFEIFLIFIWPLTLVFCIIYVIFYLIINSLLFALGVTKKLS